MLRYPKDQRNMKQFRNKFSQMLGGGRVVGYLASSFPEWAWLLSPREEDF